MTKTELLIESMTQDKQIVRCEVLSVRTDASVLVVCEFGRVDKVLCNILETSDGPQLSLASGDIVLVWLPESDEERGVVLGRIGPSHAPATETKNPEETPDELVIEAKKNLTLKCGEGSITLRKDGKILIKGKDLVSQAKRMNRIKGGSVAIN
jgi:hypothetical protein